MVKYLYRLTNKEPQESIVGDYPTFKEAEKVREEKSLTDTTIQKVRVKEK